MTPHTWTCREGVLELGADRSRKVWGLADQLVYSFSNMALAVLIARSASVEVFGQFSLALAAYTVMSVLVRGAALEPLMIKFPQTVGAKLTTDAERAATSFAVGASLVGLVVCLFVSMCLPREFAFLVITLGLSLPGLALQDSMRYISIARARPTHALVADCLQLLLQSLGILYISLGLGAVPAWNYVAVWGLTSLLVGSSHAIGNRVRPSLSSGLSWPRRGGRLVWTLGADNLLNQGGAQISVFALGGFGGTLQVGAYRAAQVLFRPVAVLLIAIRVVFLPEVSRSLKTSRSGGVLFRAMLIQSSCLGLFAVAWSGFVVFLPDSLGSEVLGDSWSVAEPLVFWISVAQVAVALRAGPEVGLRAIGKGQVILVLRTVLTVAGLALQLTAIAVGGLAVLVVVTAWWRVCEMCIWWFTSLRFGWDPRSSSV